MGTVLIGVLGFVIAGWAIWRKKAPKIQVWLMLIAGLCATGLVAAIALWATGWITTLVGKGLGALFGASLTIAGVAMAIVVVLELMHAAHPKKGKPGKIHPPLAFLAPGLIAAGGGIFAAAVTKGQEVVGHVGELALSLF